MANNPLTSGPDATSGEGENSSNSRPRTFALQQQAVQQANRQAVARDDAAKAAERRAGAAAYTASRAGIQATYTPFPQSVMPPRARGRGK